MNLTTHFTNDDFKCPCCGKLAMKDYFLVKLEAFRVRWDRPMKINSGMRCEKENARVGGVPNSRHLFGDAADVAVIAGDRYAFIKLSFECGFAGIGVGKTFIHFDCRPGQPALWKY